MVSGNPSLTYPEVWLTNPLGVSQPNQVDHQDELSHKQEAVWVFRGLWVWLLTWRSKKPFGQCQVRGQGHEDNVLVWSTAGCSSQRGSVHKTWWHDSCLQRGNVTSILHCVYLRQNAVVNWADIWKRWSLCTVWMTHLVDRSTALCSWRMCEG
jgi:hypothetical protein